MKKSAKKQSSVSDVSSLSVRKVFLDVSREPKSLYAKLVMRNKSARFVKEYRNEQGKHFVVVKVPGRSGVVKVVWGFDPQGENMRKRILEKHERENKQLLYPKGKGGHVRFPREPTRFPRPFRFPRVASAKRK